MKLLDKIEMSWWAYYECCKGNDTPEIRKLITASSYAYWYCFWIKDRKELWSRINDSYWAKSYCIDVKDRPEVRGLWDKNLKNEIIK